MMMSASIPQDLVPLPTMPWDQRPVELPLDINECRTAIWKARGNVSEAAKLLKTTSLRLRNFVRKSPFLSAEVEEAREQLVDRAEDQIYEALTDGTDAQRRDAAAKFVLMGPGRNRGYGSGAPSIKVNNSEGGTVIIGWADGTQFNPEGSDKVIDHE